MIVLITMADAGIAKEPPNIIFILGDDQAWYDYSFMRQPGVEDEAILNTPRNLPGTPPIYSVADTPALDRLANGGITFLHGVTAPICRPSLAAAVTGATSHHNRVTGNDLEGRPPDQEVEARMQVMQTIPRLLSEMRGYKSFQTGKWWEGHYSNGGFTFGDTRNSADPADRPAQWNPTEAEGHPNYATRARHGDWGLMAGRVDYVNDIQAPEHWDEVNEVRINFANTVIPVTDWIDEQNAAGEPFFIWYAPFLPHTPHDPPAKLLEKWDALIDEPDESGDYQAKYYANIERFDGGIEAIINHLDANGLTDNTLIVYYHDNGWINSNNESDHEGERSKLTPYEGGTRTPIILHWPGKIKEGGAIEPQFVRTPVAAIDIAKTIVTAAGIEPSPEMLGVDLMNLGAVEARDTIFCEQNLHDMIDFPNSSASLQYTYIYRDGWKLIKEPSGAVELYQLYNSNGVPVDPHETNDRSCEESVRVAELSAAVDAWYNTPKDMEWQAHLAQTHAIATAVVQTDFGQTFAPQFDYLLAAVRVGLKPLTLSQTIMLELRELDSSGAPLGAILACDTLHVEDIVVDELRWYRFAFEQPIVLKAGVPIGFRIVSSEGAGGFEVAYTSVDSYANGDMYYPGSIEGTEWFEAGFDLTFETLASNYRDTAQLGLNLDDNRQSAIISGNLPVKNVDAILQQSTTLDVWADLATASNADGRVHWDLMIEDDREFYRIRYSSIGEPIVLSPNPASPYYEETFDGSGSNINGRVIGDSTWIAPANSVILDDGTVAEGRHTAYIPFTPVNGFVYTLSVSMQQGTETNDDGWIAFGFIGDPPSTGYIANIGVLWALNRNLTNSYNQVLHLNVNGGTGSKNRGNYVKSSGLVPMSLVLDTTGGSGNWTYSWIVDGVTRVSNATLAAGFESAIGGVGFGMRDPAPNLLFNSFELSVQ